MGVNPLIPEGLARAAARPGCRIALPDRSGWWILLGADPSEPGIACPICGVAMAIAVVQQHVDGAIVSSTVSCIPCWPEKKRVNRAGALHALAAAAEGEEAP